MNMSHKRRSDGHLPPAKKSRSHHTHHMNSRSDSYTPPNPPKEQDIPILPPISSEYERLVFTHHTAASRPTGTEPSACYERLEWLGDAYIETMSTRLIWEQFKMVPVGRLSQAREILIKNQTLAEFFLLYRFQDRLRLGNGYSPDLHSEAMKKIRGDVFEAYVAAVILSDPVRGFEMAEDWMTQLWLPKLKGFDTTQPDLRAKEELAKSVLASGIRLSYVDERPAVVQKKQGIQVYHVGVYLTGWGWENQHLGSGKGLNKVHAGNDAASNAMNNHPLIDEIMAVRRAFLDKRKEEAEQEQQAGSIAAE